MVDYYNASIEQIDQATVWAVILGEGGLSDDQLMGDWWYGGEHYDLNVYGNEFDLNLKDNERGVAIYALDNNGNTVYDEPVTQFNIKLYKEQRQ